MDKDIKPEEAQKLLLQLTKAVFWNCDLTKFDYSIHKKHIIERILDAGLENDEIIMWKLYSYNDIKDVAINMEFLEEEKVTYMAFVLKVEENEFKCYKKKPWYQK
ncbi:MAG: hypothetical protein LBI28_09190 [Treponema sp.]|jgi:hypothetical protein|nr:hypothetical protein [Treponema sp.]